MGSFSDKIETCDHCINSVINGLGCDNTNLGCQSFSRDIEAVPTLLLTVSFNINRCKLNLVYIFLMSLTQNLWDRYGFVANPFATEPLSLVKNSALPIMDAYVSREGLLDPSTLLTNFFRNPGGGRIVVEGVPGVGKTTLVNYHRYRWEVEAEDKLLSPRTEISVQPDWTARTFLLSLLNALTSRLRLELGQKRFEKDTLLMEISAITGVWVEKSGSVNASISVLGSGGGFGKSDATNVKANTVTDDQLKEYFSRLIQSVREVHGFAGVIFHLDNLELLAQDGPRMLKVFFESIRDTIQEPHAYFVFVGYKGLFNQAIMPLERVRSIFFDTEVELEPLPLSQVYEVIQRRYTLLAEKGREWIPPVDDSVIEYLYDTFSGKIRYLMNAITSMISHIPDSYATPLTVEEATGILQKIHLGRIQRDLSPEERKIFIQAVALSPFTNASLSKKAGKTRQQINTLLRKLLDLHYIYHGEKQGNRQYYSVEPRFCILNKVTNDKK